MIPLPIDIIRAEHGLPTWRDARRLLLVIFFGGLFYGAVMGSYSGIGVDNFRQILFSAVKVPLLLMVTFSLCVPNFVVVSTLLGLRDDLAESLRALVMTQAGITIILCALAPYTAFWYMNAPQYRLAILFNGGMFAVASVSAQFILLRLYRPPSRAGPNIASCCFSGWCNTSRWGCRWRGCCGRSSATRRCRRNSFGRTAGPMRMSRSPT